MIDFDEIIDNIKCGLIIPIIGDEVLYIVNESGDKVPLQNYILQKLNEEYKQQVQEYSFKNMIVFERLSKNRKDFINNIISIVDNIDKQKVEIDPDVLCFLRNGDFPLIITTTYTNVLEQKLAGYKSVNYFCEHIDVQDVGKIADEDSYKRLANKTIFHLFGRAIKGGHPCVVTEDDFLKYLHGLSDSSTAPQNLQKYILNKERERREILALGCNIPDWVFRFLLYSMVKEDLFVKDQSFKGGVIDSVNDVNLATFLENIEYYYGNDILSFIKEINSRLQPQKRHSIFVSVFSEDLNSKVHGNQIREIIDALKTKYDIWFCEDRLQGIAGKPYWQEIRKGLQECEFFLPIITDKVLSLMPSVNGAEPTDDCGDQGIINEWKYALKAWKEYHSYPKPYALPYRFDVNIRRMANAFDIPDNPGVKALCELVFGPNCVGAQSVESVEEIDLDKLLEQ